MIKWSERLELGHEVIDAQHKKLVELLSALSDMVDIVSDGTDVFDEIRVIFGELRDYTVVHFATEEKIFSGKYENSFSERIHQKQHKEFVDRVLEFETTVLKKEQVDLEALLGFVAFLVDWLSKHILTTDKEMLDEVKKG